MCSETGAGRPMPRYSSSSSLIIWYAVLGSAGDGSVDIIRTFSESLLVSVVEGLFHLVTGTTHKEDPHAP